MVTSRSPYSLRRMEIANGVMAYGEIKMVGGKTAAEDIFPKSKVTKPVSARPPAFKIVCLFVEMGIFNDQHKVSCRMRPTNRATTCPSSSLKMANNFQHHNDKV